MSPTETVIVRSVEKVSPSVAAVTVTAVASALSETLDGLNRRVMSVLSSSVRVTLVLLIVRPVAVPSTLRVSSPSTMVSLVGVRVKVALPLVWPFVMVMSKSATVA